MNHDRSSNTDTGFTADDGQYSGQTDQKPVDELHRLLASTRRRVLLSYLMARDDDVAFDELVDHIAEQEFPDTGPANHWVRIETDLHHVHLPLLAEAGVVTYDSVEETVRYHGSEDLESLLSATSSVEARDE